MPDELNFAGLEGHLPPQNIEAEESILGGILLDPEAIGRIAELLLPEAFYISSHTVIFQAMLFLHGQSQPTDLISVASRLSDLEQLKAVGGQAKLVQLVDRTVSAVNIDRYSALVMDKYLRRQLIAAGREIDALGYDTATDLEVVLDRAEQKVFNVTQKRPQQDLVPIYETLVGTFEDIEEKHETQAQPGILTDFYDLDAMTGGLQPSDLIIVAGRPSMGKCLHETAQILQADGRLVTIGELYRQQRANLLTLGDDWKLHVAQPSQFVDDGIKPVFRVTTRLGRRVETTLSHPFLTIEGWRPLGELAVGDRIAVPRVLPVFGDRTLPEPEIELLAYFIGDGTVTDGIPRFTNSNPILQVSFVEAIEHFPGVTVRCETSGGTRTPSFCVVADRDATKRARDIAAAQLSCAITAPPQPAAAVADRIGVSPASLSHWKHGKCAPNPEARAKLADLFARDLPGTPYASPAFVQTLETSSRANSVKCWLEAHQLWGENAHQKTIPDCIFQLPKPQLALFVNRLFATDGWVSTLASGQVQVGYTSVSRTLVKQLQHLLLRFGILAALKPRQIRYKDTRRPAWQLDITHADSIAIFLEEIGVLGKEAAVDRAKQQLAQRRRQFSRDLIPKTLWTTLKALKGGESWKSLAERAGIQGASNIHVGKRDLSRARLRCLADALGDRNLVNLAESDVYWDEIVAIEPIGDRQVYDLTVPETHNFIADDICVHNTAISLNIAQNIAKAYRLPIAIFSLEMSKEQLGQRLRASEAGIEASRLRAGRVSQNEWEPFNNALASLSEMPIFIDDTPNVVVSEIRSKCRRLQAEQGQSLGLVLLDYLQLMEGGGDNRVQEISRITRSLKGLARELNVPVVVLSQLSRGVEARTNKRPMMSDLRESGSIEQDADLIVMLYRDEYYNPDTPDRGITELILAKHRNGPTGIVRLLFDSQYTRFRNMAGNFQPGSLNAAPPEQLPPM